MEFRTKIPIYKSICPIDYSSDILSLGSCFAVNMAEKFQYYQFRNTVNPFGILFHPAAIEKFIGFAVSEKEFTDEDVFFHNERWHCFDAHSDLSHPDKRTLLDNLNATVASVRSNIASTSHLILTLGTAWTYRKIESGEWVANCHKLPQKEFEKELLSVGSIAESLNNIVENVKKTNPGIQIILTISPVRHLKDGFVENQQSKAHLIAAVRIMMSVHGNIHYFPSYEIMMDELRDYRFYAQDMIHPNQTAIDYIWERFAETWIAPAAFPILEEIAQIRKSLVHRPFNPDSQNHRLFLDDLERKIALLRTRFPHMSF